MEETKAERGWQHVDGSGDVDNVGVRYVGIELREELQQKSTGAWKGGKSST
jgi:hypothetical protein